ncbi:MAG TPA: response regulator [Kofleriaceae bacterium]|jgi:PAS domain S-box-containing protein
MSQHTIMVVDDNSVTRRMVKNALVRSGHNVIEAADGATARRLMRSERPRVVLQDLMLPDADGFELVGELRELAGGTEVSILAFSGFVSELDEARVSTVGFDDIIAKPIAPSRLVPIIEAHLPVPVPSTGRFGTGRRVIIADDDPMQLKLATFRLARLGFDVEAVPDGRAALEAVKRHLPDALVSDVMMPEMDGFALAMAVRQDPKLRQLPVLLVTSSYVEPADRDLAKRAGANDLLPRTPELVELLDALDSALAESHPTHVEIEPDTIIDLEKEHNQRVFRQLERQVMLNTGLARRCSALASELTVLTGISEAVLKHRDVDVALDEALAECFDAGGIAVGALFLFDDGKTTVRALGSGHPVASNEDLESFFGHQKLLHETLRGGRTLYLPSPEVPKKAAAELLERTQATAMLVVPLTYMSEVIGGLMMVSRGRDLDQGDWTSFARGVANQISHVLSLARAYEEREKAERRAIEHAALLDAMVGNMPDWVVHTDLEGVIHFCNRDMRDLKSATLKGRNLLTLGPDCDHKRELNAAMKRLIETGAPQGFEAPLVFSDGTMWLSTRIGPVLDNGRLVGAVVVARDVSDKKQTELHLMVADRMASVGTLAAGVAHEINNPLASVIANVDMALQDVIALPDKSGLPPDLIDELEDARTAADRVREIVRDLKIFSRAEEERHGPVDVEHVLESTLRMAWNELRHRAKLVKNYHKVPLVEANESRLGQVFLNLIINAAHAIPTGNYEGNRITITTSYDPKGSVVVSISDTGTGIPVEVRPRLFTPFFTTKPVGVGTGLGLAISHRIITQLGGTLTFDTEVGKGTDFKVTLPVAIQQVQARVAARPTTAPAIRRGTVLVVDDEEPLVQAIRKYLAHDHEVIACTSARTAQELLEGGARYDVILCDLMMPQVTGMDLFAEVLRLDPSQANRMVFLTGGAFTASAREFLDSSTNIRLEKPFDLKELRKLVNELIR